MVGERSIELPKLCPGGTRRRRIGDAAPLPDARAGGAAGDGSGSRACRKIEPVTVVTRLATDLGAGGDGSAAPRHRAALMGSGIRA